MGEDANQGPDHGKAIPAQRSPEQSDLGVGEVASVANVIHVAGAGPGGSTIDSVVQAGSVHGDIHLHGAERANTTPHQLPLPPRHFINRATALSALHALLGSRDRPSPYPHVDGREPRPSIAVISGSAGIGKSVLASVSLHRLGSDFPDGALYADLKGFADTAPADPGDVLGGFVRALGAPPGSIPEEAAGRAALFRSLTHGRRVALLLDDAVSAAQVRHLLPGPAGPGVIVTSRYRLSSLIALDGALAVELGPLDDEATVGLFTRYLGSKRCATEAEAVSDLVELTGRLPLAVCAVASRIAQRPLLPVRRTVERLSRAHDRLWSFGAEENLSVHAALDTSYAALGSRAQRMYRRLGLHPGPDLAAPAAAVLDLDHLALPEHLDGLGPLPSGPTPEDVEAVEDALYDLVEASLLEEVRPGRFRQHDLIRLHAQQRAEVDDSAETITAARRRLSAYYVRTTASAELVLNPGRWRLAEIFTELADAAPDTPFTDRAEALAWVEAELASLRALLEFLRSEGEHAAAWTLCEALSSTFLYLKNFDLWLWACEIGESAAEAAGNTSAQALMATSSATAHLHRQRPELARPRFEHALRLWQDADHTLGRAAALEGIGVAFLAQGSPLKARERFLAALDIHEHLGRDRGAALMRRRLGETSRDLRRHGEARSHFRAALDHFTAAAEPYMRVRVLLGAAENDLRAGEREGTGLARAALDEAEDLSVRIGARAETARAHELRADLAEHEGDTLLAREHLNRALELHDALGTPHAAAIRRRLENLDAPSPPSGGAP